MEQIEFNKRFSATRILIENSFGILKSRFRQLLQLEIHSVDKITKFIISSCVLHNLCINMHDYIESHDMTEDYISIDDRALEEPGDIMDSEFILKRNGEKKRDTIKNSLQYQ